MEQVVLYICITPTLARPAEEILMPEGPEIRLADELTAASAQPGRVNLLTLFSVE
jgi:hypothetical protein